MNSNHFEEIERLQRQLRDMELPAYASTLIGSLVLTCISIGAALAFFGAAGCVVLLTIYAVAAVSWAPIVRYRIRKKLLVEYVDKRITGN
jgi:hypothetical protein